MSRVKTITNTVWKWHLCNLNSKTHMNWTVIAPCGQGPMYQSCSMVFWCNRAPRCRTGRLMYDLGNKAEGLCNNKTKTCEKAKMLETQSNMPKWAKVEIFTRLNEWQQSYNNKQRDLRARQTAAECCQNIQNNKKVSPRRASNAPVDLLQQ